MTESVKGKTDKPAEAIVTVRIELLDTHPLIWREVEVPASFNLKKLHQVIQAAMGWFDYHLWEFETDRGRYGPIKDDDGSLEPKKMASKVHIASFLRGDVETTTFGYCYDFGDSWEMRVTVGGWKAKPGNRAYPRYVAGEWNAPPEDCGGVPGFYDLLELLESPKGVDSEDLPPSLLRYDPKMVDEARIRKELQALRTTNKPPKTRRVWMRSRT